MMNRRDVLLLGALTTALPWRALGVGGDKAAEVFKGELLWWTPILKASGVKPK